MTAPSTKTEVMQLIERARLAMPLNPIVRDLCDLLERATIELARRANAVSNVSSDVSSVSRPVSIGVSRPKVDRKTYMRDLMRRRRAAKRVTIGGTKPVDSSPIDPMDAEIT